MSSAFGPATAASRLCSPAACLRLSIPFEKGVVHVADEDLAVAKFTGFGRQKGHAEHYRGVEYKAEFQPKLKLDILIRDDQVAETTKAIEQAAKTGKFGDGKIFVSDVNDVLRIRTGDRGEQAL